MPVNDNRFPILVLADELVFGRKVIGELAKRVGCQIIQFDACSGIKREPLKSPIQDFVLAFL